MKKIYLLLLFCCLGNFAFATVNVALSAPYLTPAANVCAGATDVAIYGFTLTWSGSGSTVTSVSVTLSGTAVVPGDVLRYHLRYSSNGSLIATSTTANFTGLSLTQSVSYYITADIAAAPNQGRTIIVNAMSGANLTVSAGTTSTTGTPAAGGTQTILVAPAPITGNAQMCTGGSTIVLGEASIGGTWYGGTSGVATINEGSSLTATVTSGANQGTTTISYSNVCNTASITATVNATPAAIGGNAQMCAGYEGPVLTNTSTNGTWSGGTAGIATIDINSGIIHAGLTQGTTTISYTNGCGTAIITATVNALPAPIGGSTQLCVNSTTVTLTNTSTNGTWSGGIGGVATVNSQTGLVTSGTSAGTTTISYTNGCTPAATITVTVSPLPTIHTFTGGGAYCAGDTGVHVGLTLSDPGVSYQLYNGSTPVSSVIPGTGADIDFGLYTAAGVYHAIATNMVTTCTSYLSGITITINPLPDTFTVFGGGSFCASDTGVHIMLDGSATGIKYQLYNGSNPMGSPVAGTGDTLDFGLQTVGGNYTVIASNATTDCPQTMAGSVAVTPIILPAYTVTGGGAYCTNDTAVHIGLSNSTAGTIYQLYNGSSPVGNPDTSAGGAIDFGLQAAAGTYTVNATDPVTTCSAMMTGSVTVTANQPPVVYNMTGGGLYCAGSAGVLIGLSGSYSGITGISYQLYNDGVADSLMYGTGGPLNYGLVTDTGHYNIVATDTTTHCMSAMNDTISVSITPVVVPHLVINTGEGDGDTICAWSPVTFTAQTLNGGAAPYYQWTVNNQYAGTNDSTYTYLASGDDLVAVTMTSNAACAMPSTLHDTIRLQIEIPEPASVSIAASPATSISAGEQVTLTATPTNCGTTPRYQWYNNGVAIAGAVNATYTSTGFTNLDSISVSVITSGLCGGRVTDNSVIINVFPAGITQVNAGSDIKLIPNPNKGEFMLSGTLNSVNDENVSVEITNMLGQVIYKSQIMTQNGTINERIQPGNMPTGMYILNLKSANETNVFRFVVEQ